MKKIMIVLVVGAFAIGSFFYYKSFGNESEHSVVQVPNFASVPVTYATIVKKVKGRGKIISGETNDVWIDDLKKIKQVHIKKGDLVKKGMLLVTLKSDEIEKEKREAYMNMVAAEYETEELKKGDQSDSIVKAMREIELAGMEYEHQSKESEISEKLYKAKAISLNQYQESLSQLKKTEFRYDGEKMNLAKLREKQKKDLELSKIKFEKTRIIYEELQKEESDLLIKAELNGKVITVKNSSDSKEPFIVISNPNVLEVKLQVDAYDIDLIKTGNKVEIFLEQYKELITGTVKEIGSEVIKKENAFGGESPNIVEITAALDGKIPDSLKLGLEVEADIVINEHKNILVLPLELIQSEGGKTFVLCVTGKGVSTKKYVETGVSDDIHVEIKKGLTIEDKVVIKGAFVTETVTATKNLSQELVQ